MNSNFRISVLLFFLLLLQKGTAQFANTWYFGANAGLKFNTAPPTALSTGQTSNVDNTSTMSDRYGNLYFYTDGSSVWNKNSVLMPNGTGLVGNYSAGQCAVIIPIPCDSTKYVIFHVTEYSNPGYLHYTVVDMTLNSGLGDVVVAQKNMSLGSGWTEKICAYYNSVGNSYWVVVHKWNSDQFVAFEVSASSIATNSVVSSIGSVHSCGSYGSTHDAMGQLTISPDGTKLLNALTCQDKFELFNFNSTTGALSNSISIAGSGGSAWGTAFSPDSKKIYMNSIFGTTIYQYDISTYSQNAIIASQYAVATAASSGYNFGYMELGPDNKLYIAKPYAAYICVINNPNTSGASCNFSLTGPGLGTKSSNWGLSRIAYNIPYNAGAVVSVSPGTSTLCQGNTATLSASGALTYTWQPGNLSGQTITVSPLATTVYTVIGASGSCISSASVMINYALNPTVTITAPRYLCSGQATTLSASGASTYTWQPGNLSSQTITISPLATNVYTVTGTSGGCSSSASIMVTGAPNPTVTIPLHHLFVLDRQLHWQLQVLQVIPGAQDNLVRLFSFLHRLALLILLWAAIL